VCTFEINIQWTVLSFDQFKCLNRQGYMHHDLTISGQTQVGGKPVH